MMLGNYQFRLKQTAAANANPAAHGKALVARAARRSAAAFLLKYVLKNLQNPFRSRGVSNTLHRRTEAARTLRLGPFDRLIHREHVPHFPLRNEVSHDHHNVSDSRGPVRTAGHLDRGDWVSLFHCALRLASFGDSAGQDDFCRSVRRMFFRSQHSSDSRKLSSVEVIGQGIDSSVNKELMMWNRIKDLQNRCDLVQRLPSWNIWSQILVKQQKPQLLLIASVAALIGIGLSVAARTAIDKAKPIIVPTSPTSRPTEAAKQAVLQNLDWAEVQAKAGLDAHVAAVKNFFHTARQATRSYAEAVLGWNSKWKLASDYVTGSQEHQAFLQREFEGRLFSEAELKQLVQQTVNACLRHTDDVEAQMLVRLKADLDRLPDQSVSTGIDIDALQATLQTALHQVATAAQAELGAAVGREVVSYVAGEALTYAGAQLATSAGILTTGAGSSWATLGVGIVVSLIADAIVTEIYNQQFDPAGKLAEMLNSQLDQMESLILQGTSASPGLQSRLMDYTARRNAARRQLIQQAVLSL